MAALKFLTPPRDSAGSKSQVEDAGSGPQKHNGVFPIDYGNFVKWNNKICLE